MQESPKGNMKNVGFFFIYRTQNLLQKYKYIYNKK